MFPMVSSLNEVIEAKKILESVKRELAERKIAFDDAIEIGIIV